MDILIVLAAELAVGGWIGYVLGRESPRRCMDCLSNETGGYIDGHKAGYRDGVQMTVDRVRALGIETQNTYTVTKDELERIRTEAVETAYV